MSDLPPDAMPEWNDEERALWKSALDDRPPRRSLAATLQAVGVGSAITTAATGAGAGVVAKAGAGLALFKWGAVVGLAGAVAVGGGLISRRSTAPTAPVAAATTRSEAAPREAPRTNEAPPAPADMEAAPAPAEQPVTRPRLATAARASSAASQPDIGQEIESIDSARALVREGKTKEALSALKNYKGKSLGVEATVLRIEALVKQGDHARASSLANSFLAAHPKSPYSSRIRALLRKSER